MRRFFSQDKLVEPSAHVRPGKKRYPIRASCTNIRTRVWELFFVVPRRVSICLYTKHGLGNHSLKRGLDIFSFQDERVQIILHVCPPGKKIGARGTIGISALPWPSIDLYFQVNRKWDQIIRTTQSIFELGLNLFNTMTITPCWPLFFVLKLLLI